MTKSKSSTTKTVATSTTKSAKKVTKKGKTKLQLLTEALTKKLSRKVGSKNAISNPALISELQSEGFTGLHQSVIRTAVHNIRVKNLVKNLVANNKGYYVTRSKAEMAEYVQSLKERETTIRRLRIAIEKNMAK